MLLWLAYALAIFWTWQAVSNLPSLLIVAYLPESLSQQGAKAPPAVTIIVAACDEEETIVQTLEQLASQTYPNCAIVAINDRSTDHTGERMREVAARRSQIRVVDIEALPHGWLGKNHALYIGAMHAQSEWLLFTDADVIFEPSAVARMVTYARANMTDHLVVTPQIDAPSLTLKALIAFFLLNFTLAFRPQKVSNPRSRAFIGMGACNFVRRSAYESVGGHEAIKRRPDEDIRLGQRLKRAGFRQAFCPARHFARVRWYPSVSAMARGLEKNTLALFLYSPSLLMTAMIPYALVYVGPFAELFWLRGATEWLAVYTACLTAMLYLASLRFTDYSRWLVLTLPFAASLFGGILVRAALLTGYRGGIDWRGTFYPLSELRRKGDS